MRGAGDTIWQVAGQKPARMMNGDSCVDSDVTDINLQVDFISLLLFTPPPLPSHPLEKPSGLLFNFCII